MEKCLKFALGQLAESLTHRYKNGDPVNDGWIDEWCWRSTTVTTSTIFIACTIRSAFRLSLMRSFRTIAIAFYFRAHTLIYSFIYCFRVPCIWCPLTFNWVTIYSHLNLNHSVPAPHSTYVFVLFSVFFLLILFNFFFFFGFFRICRLLPRSIRSNALVSNMESVQLISVARDSAIPNRIG